MNTIHVSKFGTYHPAPNESVAWAVNDTRGYINPGPACDTCGACECGPCVECPPESHSNLTHPACAHWEDDGSDKPECIGLSFAFVCLDGGDSLCEDCAAKEVNIIPCDCQDAS